MAEWRTLVRERLAGMDLDPATVDDVIEELAQHLDDRYRGLLAGGVPEVEARARSLAEIDGHPRLQRDLTRLKRPLQPAPPVQDPSGNGWRALLQDLQFAWRRLRHAPGFAALAVVTLALAVGANTAILSFADAVLFRPLPYADPDRVFTVLMSNPATGRRGALVPYRVSEAIGQGGFWVGGAGLLDSGPRVQIATAEGRRGLVTASVSPNYFDVLGVRALRGRVLGQQDVGNEERAVLSFSAWHQFFGGQDAVVGSPVTVGESAFDVVGVLPPDMFFPTMFASEGRPLLVTLMKPVAPETPGGTFYPVIRLPDGVTLERAQAQVEAATARVGPLDGQAVPVLQELRTVFYPVGRPIMRFLLVASGLVLLIGCANLANMMLVRGRRRARETAVRLALGASRARLIRPILFEAFYIGGVSALVAIAITAVSFDALVALVPKVAYGHAPVGVSSRVALAALALGLGAALLFAVVPAWRAAGVDVLALIQNRRSRRGEGLRLGRPLVVVQVALAIVVVFGAVVATRAFVSVLRIPLGFSPENVIHASMGLMASRQPYIEAAERLRRRADILSLGVGGSIPFSGRGRDLAVRVNGAQAAAGAVQILPGYFESIGAPLIHGRALAWDDIRANPGAAVLSASAARAMFPGQDPLGRSFDTGGEYQFHVVGVVADVRDKLGASADPALAYVITPPTGRSFLGSLMIRTRERREATLAEIRAELKAVAPNVPVSAAWWTDEISNATAYRNPRFQSLVLGTFALLALGVTTLGIFAIVGHQVVSRTREMGVRLAIGATPQSLVTTVVRQAIAPVVVGLGFGLLLIRWARELAEAQLYEVNTRDPWTLAAATAAVLVAALVAAYLPARRATRIDPVAVLRAD